MCIGMWYVVCVGVVGVWCGVVCCGVCRVVWYVCGVCGVCVGV